MRDTVSELDRIRRFLFEHHPVHGHVVQLGSAWIAMREHTEYPPAVRDLLGEATCAAVLLASTLKFEGTLTLQLQGDGAVHLLVAQCTHDFRVRAVARYDAERIAEDFRVLVGTGRITVTIESEERASRYQGIVPLEGPSLEACIDAYFASSEQLPTQVRLAANASRAGGYLLQRIPQSGGSARHDQSSMEAADTVWERSAAELAFLDADDLLLVAPEVVLLRNTAIDDVRLFQGSPVRFECRCDRERVAGILRSLGKEEIAGVVREQGNVTVTCEFCQRPYTFDAIDAAQLFAVPTSGSEGPGRIN